MRLSRIATIGVACASALVLSACGPGAAPAPSDEPAPGVDELRMLVGGDADDVAALEAAVAPFTEETGVRVRVVLATDLEQQLAESFANASPPDVFALPTTSLDRYADYLQPFGRLASADQLVPGLLQSATVGGELQCVPRSADALALAIDEERWAEAGLGDDDVPTTWDGLEVAADALATDDVAGLAIDADALHLGTLLRQAGGGLVDASGAIADSPENLLAVELVARMADAGSLRTPADLDASSSAEALARGDAAMALVDAGDLLAARADAADAEDGSVEGTDAPEGTDPSATPEETTDDAGRPAETGDGAAPGEGAADGGDASDDSADATEDPQAAVAERAAEDDALLDGVRIVPLPAGPETADGLAVATCWALPADGRALDESRALVEHLLADDAQVALAAASGSLPVTTTAGDALAEALPRRAPFIDALGTATDLRTWGGSQDALTALDDAAPDLLAPEADPEALLADLQERIEATLD